MNKIYFITGVNGVGKSSIIPYLKSKLSDDKFVVYDFDSRGVPEDADQKWRMSETKYWISEGMSLIGEGKRTIICGFIKPSDIQAAALPEISLILLDAKPEIVRQRLIGRYTKGGIFDVSQKVIGKPIEEFITGNAWYAGKMREEFELSAYPVINTSTLNPKAVAKEVIKIILGNK
jgi:broad-specificity NMP kinase